MLGRPSAGVFNGLKLEHFLTTRLSVRRVLTLEFRLDEHKNAFLTPLRERAHWIRARKWRRM